MTSEDRKTRRAAVRARLKESNTFTPEQEAMLLGTLLGDGYVSPEGLYTARHGLKQAEYIWTKYTVLREYVLGLPSKSTKNKLGFESLVFFTVTGPAFSCFRSLCYPNGKKTVTTEWLDRIDRVGFLQAIAWWIADDGSRTGNSLSSSLVVATNGFSFREVELLRDWMTRRGYPCRVYSRKAANGPQPMLSLSAESTRRLMADLRPYTPPSMLYKLESFDRQSISLICTFCGKPFSPKKVKSVTPSTLCCGAAECRRERERRRHNALPLEAKRAKAERAKARLEADPTAAERARRKRVEWVKNNPDRVRAAKQKYLQKQKRSNRID